MCGGVSPCHERLWVPGYFAIWFLCKPMFTRYSLSVTFNRSMVASTKKIWNDLLKGNGRRRNWYFSGNQKAYHQNGIKVPMYCLVTEAPFIYFFQNQSTDVLSSGKGTVFIFLQNQSTELFFFKYSCYYTMHICKLHAIDNFTGE